MLISRFPPATFVQRPERRDRRAGALDRTYKAISGVLKQLFPPRAGLNHDFVSEVERLGKPLESMDMGELRMVANRLRSRLQTEGFRQENVARAFSLVRETAGRTIGMRHFPTQLMGGWVLLKGMVAEMETGEGKTLTATLPAATAALAGVPVHVISVNDYLTRRDSELMGPVYNALGLSVGCIIHELGPDERRNAYSCDITYCTNKEIAFDYLKDWISLKGRVNPLRLQAEYLYGRNGAKVHSLLLRGLHYAIVDEADSILIDEARTPLIISATRGGGDDESEFMKQALFLAGELVLNSDYTIDRAARKVQLARQGKERVRELASGLGPLWTGAVRREELVTLALTAEHLFRRDEQYLVKDGKIHIVDEFTGRLMSDRSYEKGLHQLIEIKEGCEVTRHPETLARISYQRFFKRYLHLSGMTGTAMEVRGELQTVYGLSVMRIPTNRKMQRKGLPDLIYVSEEEKWNSLVNSIEKIHRKGRPVLVGTRSVHASEKVGLLLSSRGLNHQVLNARQDQQEAEIISRAGQAGCITIATNMAGRGTDIKLGPGVSEKGGLHVILTERHEAGRIDRQLAGRCGRQGDPGSFQAVLSLTDPILEGGRGGTAAWLARKIGKPGSPIWDRLARRAILKAQKKVEHHHAGIRKSLLRQDEQRGDALSFSGISE